MFKVRQLSLESSEKPQKNHRKFQKVLDKGGFMCYITYAAVVKRHIEYGCERKNFEINEKNT